MLGTKKRKKILSIGNHMLFVCKHWRQLIEWYPLYFLLSYSERVTISHQTISKHTLKGENDLVRCCFLFCGNAN